MEHDLTELTQQLKADSSEVRTAAAEGLCRMADAARPAAVALVAACGDPCEEVVEWSSAALESLGPPLPQQMGDLARLASAAEPDVSYWAITLLGRLGPAAAPAVPALIAALEHHGNLPSRQRAAWALEKIGPAAAPARAALVAASASDDPRLARLAASALQKISASPND